MSPQNQTTMPVWMFRQALGTKGGDIIKPLINLKKLRQDRGWTQSQAAAKLGFCRSYISSIENGKQGLSVAMMNSIIRVFGVRYEDFYDGKND